MEEFFMVAIFPGEMCSPFSALIIISNPVCFVPKLKINIIRIKNWMSQARQAGQLVLQAWCLL